MMGKRGSSILFALLIVLALGSASFGGVRGVDDPLDPVVAQQIQLLLTEWRCLDDGLYTIDPLAHCNNTSTY